LANDIRAAVIGLGKMGLLHASTLGAMGGVKVVALCEKSRFLTRFARKAVPSVTVVEEVSQLAGKGLDVVFVTTPIPSHTPIVRQLYLEGIASNVFSEKTLSSNHSDSLELCSLAERASGVTMVGYQRRFGVTFAKARELLHEGSIGEAESFEAHAFSSDFAGVEGGDMLTGRGGVLRDLGSHAIDMALWFFGDLTPVRSTAPSPSSSVPTLPMTFGARTAGGLEGEIKASWSVKGYRMAEIGISVKGSRGMVSASDDMVVLTSADGATKRFYRQDLHDDVPFLLGGPEYFRQDAEMIRCLREGTSPEDSFLSASRVDGIIDAAESFLK